MIMLKNELKFLLVESRLKPNILAVYCQSLSRRCLMKTTVTIDDDLLARCG